MRVIKLSPNDPDMKTRKKVDQFFLTELPKQERKGRFFFPKGRIAKNGIQPGEWLIFTYLGNIVYTARSASHRLENKGIDAQQYQYPFYFCIDTSSISSAQGSLSGLEEALRSKGLLNRNLVKSQGWPIIAETDKSRELIYHVVTHFDIED